ncbi:MAG: cysteine synthase family protein [Acidobacteria bacterium]|nr:cysteine synthase family protein [Acidobacteriota bacterium]
MRSVSAERRIEEAVGRTPLLALRRLTGHLPGIELYAKAEWLNPGGSVKDRAALEMLLEGERSGALRPGKSILEATSGNTGISVAMLGAARGYAVRLCLPATASPERKRILRAYRADVIETDRLEGTDGAIRKARELVQAEPDRYFYPDQYNNPANWRAHYRTTAAEIWEQTGGRITHFVAGLGTSGTFVGATRRLKQLSPSVACISFQPDSPLHGIEGLKHLATSLVPGIYDRSLADGNEEVSTEEAQEWTLRLAREEGLFVGPSSGAALAVALKVAQRAQRGVVVTVFPDGGEKYLSEPLWSQ